jgi:hypothetical protein
LLEKAFLPPIKAFEGKPPIESFPAEREAARAGTSPQTVWSFSAMKGELMNIGGI